MNPKSHSKKSHRRNKESQRLRKPSRCRYTRIQDAYYHYDGKARSTMMTLGMAICHLAQKAFTLKSLMSDRETTVANKSRRQLSAVADTHGSLTAQGQLHLLLFRAVFFLSLVFGYGITPNPVTESWSTWNAPPRTYPLPQPSPFPSAPSALVCFCGSWAQCNRRA